MAFGFFELSYPKVREYGSKNVTLSDRGLYTTNAPGALGQEII